MVLNPKEELHLPVKRVGQMKLKQSKNHTEGEEDKLSLYFILSVLATFWV